VPTHRAPREPLGSRFPLRLTATVAGAGVCVSTAVAVAVVAGDRPTRVSTAENDLGNPAARIVATATPAATTSRLPSRAGERHSHHERTAPDTAPPASAYRPRHAAGPAPQERHSSAASTTAPAARNAGSSAREPSGGRHRAEPSPTASATSGPTTTPSPSLTDTVIRRLTGLATALP
jgi:hypothetical protein